ncbi:MAG: hypothetical protein RIR33_445 [Pseudomonadota bacterium]|jgi:hypothetical protein
MILAFVFLIILVALSIDGLWLLALFGAVAAMHWTASMHLSDPLAPLYAFFIGAVAARLALEIVRSVPCRRMV